MSLNKDPGSSAYELIANASKIVLPEKGYLFYKFLFSIFHKTCDHWPSYNIVVINIDEERQIS